MVNYYRDMWPQRSHLLAPLSSLTSAKVKWTWTEEYQTSFDNMKKLIAKETLLTYPNFNKTFEIHTDASKVQLGACISQEGKPVAFYSRKLNPAQTRYTTTERELLSIVETLKEFRNIPSRTTNHSAYGSCKSHVQKFQLRQSYEMETLH